MSEQLIQAIAHRDSQTLARLASKYQPAQERTAKSVVNTEAERLVDSLFRQPSKYSRRPLRRTCAPIPTRRWPNSNGLWHSLRMALPQGNN